MQNIFGRIADWWAEIKKRLIRKSTFSLLQQVPLVSVTPSRENIDPEDRDEAWLNVLSSRLSSSRRAGFMDTVFLPAPRRIMTLRFANGEIRAIKFGDQPVKLIRACAVEIDDELRVVFAPGMQEYKWAEH